MKFRINDKVMFTDGRQGIVIRIRRSWIRRSIPYRAVVKWNRGGRETVSTSELTLLR